MNEHWHSVMLNLKDRHSEIAHIISNRTVAFIDIPFYFNVGDLLIYKGTEQFFRDYNINVTYRSGCRPNYRNLARCDVIIFQGGGNFGDLYTVHHRLREDTVARFPDKTIICLPQSLFFRDERERERSAKIFSNHDSFHLYVRDEYSLGVSEAFSDKAELLPDMAHSLYPSILPAEHVQLKKIEKESNVLDLLRRDIEQRDDARHANDSSKDWIDLISNSDKLILECLRACSRLSVLESNALNIWGHVTQRLILKAVSLFLAHDVINTDRLHGYILSCLLAKQVHWTDNSYHKISRYRQAFLKDYPFEV